MSSGRPARWLALLGSVLALACAEVTPREPPPKVREREPFATGEAQLERLCGRGRDDLVIDAFCAGGAPEIRGFTDLRAALHLDTNENGIEQGFALNGHSTSLASRVVSAINPRIIFVRVQNHRRELTALAFARGEQFSEMVVRDRKNGELTFYLGAFTLACEETEAGCSPADRFTPDFEAGWTDFNVYGEEDVENSPLDCRVCHQPGGPGTPKLLRMQEFEPPWTHWFYRLSVGGRALLSDYFAAKSDERFAGLGEQDIRMSQPGILSGTISESNAREQPNQFPTTAIEDEVEASAAANGGDQPYDNSVPGESGTWRDLYERAKRAEAISVPYHDVKVSDPEKLAALTRAYADYRQGNLPRERLPDLSDVFPDDPQLRAEMGLETEPGLSGQDVLLQACGQCHNKRLDQTVSRARFSVDLERMSRAEKQRAIARIKLAKGDPYRMPPALVRQLSEDEREKLIELLDR